MRFLTGAVCTNAQHSQQEDPGFMLAVARLGNALESVAAPALPSSQDDGFALPQPRGGAAAPHSTHIASKGRNLQALAWL